MEASVFEPSSLMGPPITYGDLDLSLDDIPDDIPFHGEGSLESSFNRFDPLRFLPEQNFDSSSEYELRETNDHRTSSCGDFIIRVGPASSLPGFSRPALRNSASQDTPSASAERQSNLMRRHRNGRRLRLEYTFVQWSENNVEGAVKAFREARSLYARRPLGHDFVLRTAMGLNAARYNLGSVNKQLEAALIRGMLKHGEGSAWQQFLPGQLTAVRAMQAVANGTHLTEPRKVHFNTGPWAGRSVSCGEIQCIAKQKRWEIMAPVLMAKISLAETLLEQMKQTSPQDVQYEELAALAARLCSDYWTVNCILTFTSYVEDEQNAPFQQLSKESASLPSDEMMSIVERLEITKDQLQHVKMLRQLGQELMDQNSSQEEQLSLTLQEILDLAVDHQSDLQLLDILERLRLVKLAMRTLQVEIAHTFMFRILTPRQLGVLKLSIGVAKPIAFWRDWMILMSNSIVSFKHNRWIDAVVPTEIIGCMHL